MPEIKFARIVQNVAVDVCDAMPEGRYHPDLLAEFVEVPQLVVEGSQLVRGRWKAPPTPSHEPPAPLDDQ